MSKKNKKSFVLSVVVKGKDVPDFGGLGKGVLVTQEVSFTDEADQGFNTATFEAAKRVQEDRLANMVLEFRWEETCKS